MVSNDAIRVVSGLLPRPTLSPEREARLVEISSELKDIHTRYKRHAEAALRYAITMGKLLTEAKSIVGHGRFMPWVRDNCPFSHPTANNYMYVAQANIKIVRLMNLVEQGTVNAIESTRRRRPREPTLAEIYGNRRRKKRWPSWRDNITFRRNQIKENRAARSAQYEEWRMPDLTNVWPRPHHDCACLEIEWQLPDHVIQGIYVWVPENAHAAARSTIEAATHGHWKGGVALRYHWLIYKYVYPRPYRLEFDEDGRFRGASDSQRRYLSLQTPGMTWEQVQAKLLELSEGAIDVRKLAVLERDPARTAILDLWRQLSKSTRQPYDVLDPRPLI